MKKYICVLTISIFGFAYADGCPPSVNELCNYSNGTFFHLDNYLGISLLGAYNQSIFSNSGNNSYSGGAPGVEARFDILTQNSFWLSNRINYVNYLGVSNYASDQTSYMLKMGYSFQPIYDYWEIIPYVSGSAGAGQETWDSQINYGVGGGVRTEVALITRNSLYADYNIQYLIDGGNFANSYNQQFGSNNTSLHGYPYGQNIELGYKHVIDCETTIDLFYRYSTNQMGFSSGLSQPNINYINQTQMVGIGINWYL